MKKAVSPTGARLREAPRRVRGFTLIETLFAILILSSGIIFIAPALFKSGVIMTRVACGYQADLLAGNLISEKEEDLRKFNQMTSLTTRGTARMRGTDFFYEIEASSQDRLMRLYQLTVRIHWKDIRENQIIRTAYILR